MGLFGDIFGNNSRWDRLEKLILTGFGVIMAQIDDLKAAQAETKVQQAAIAASLTDLSADVDALVALVGTPNVDLSEVLSAAQEIQSATTALATAAADAAAKYPAPAPVV